MFYVSEILSNVCSELSAPIPQKKMRNSDKPCFSISNEKLLQFEYDENGMYVGDIARKLNSLVDLSLMQKLKVKSIFDWLIKEKLIYLYVPENGKEYRKITENGKAIGLIEELKVGANGGAYTNIICSVKAQQYIVELSNSIAKNDIKLARSEFHGKPWTPEQDKLLVTMFNDGFIVAEIANELKRTPGAIRARLVKLGLVNYGDNII